MLGCNEPVKLGVHTVMGEEVTLFWEDNSGPTEWEYFVQKKGAGVPVKAGVGTKMKENKVVKDGERNAITPNTDYEFYVRNKCVTTGYSEWSGPFEFTTICIVEEAPYWEGFNSGDLGYRCWTILDTRGNEVKVGGKWNILGIAFEGDKGISFTGNSKANDWLITPGIKLDNGEYILKYHYKTTNDINNTQHNEFEVLMSRDGIDRASFDEVLVPSKVYKQGNFDEEVVFIDGKNTDINIAWHINSNSNETYFYLDNVVLKKIETCAEPYFVKTTGVTENSASLEWESKGGTTSWEVIVVDYKGDVDSEIILKQIVNNDSKVTITGLDSGRGYSVYVRAVCEEGVYSDWGTGVNFTTKVGANDICTGALNLPVNPTLDCVASVSVTNIGASLSEPEEDTNTFTCLYYGVVNDLWFEFTATSTFHILKANNMNKTSGSGNGDIYALLYDNADCSQNLGPNAIPSHCGRLLEGGPNYEFVYRDLVVGQKYFLKLGFRTNDYYIFDLCLTTPSPLKISASGTEYSIEELIKDVFVTSSCDVVSNVTYKNGDGGAAARRYNTFGAFERGDSSFPFEKGIVLSTNEVDYIAGPWRGGTAERGSNDERWIGDKDVNDAINNAGGGPRPNKRVTQVEFEFTPLKDSIQFEYLFASNSYLGENGNYIPCHDNCDVGALFAAWLIDTTLDEGENLAKVPGTNMPISINTVRDVDKSGALCENINAQYYDKHYDGVDIPAESPIDFVGYTVPMKSAMTAVVPGRKYRIKFAVIDFCTTVSHSSAVFFNAASFDLGALDLGDDLLIESGNALCERETRIIKANTPTSSELHMDIVWKKDGVVIRGENTTELAVSESGTYTMEVTYPDVNCSSSSSVIVEIFPPIADLVNQPSSIEMCTKSLESIVLDLTVGEHKMFERTNRDDFMVTYFTDKNAAEENIGEMTEPNAVDLGVEIASQSFYIRVESIITGCFEVFELNVLAKEGELPNKLDDIAICAEYVFPALEKNQHYYSGSAASGVEYFAGETIDTYGDHTIYVLQLNGDAGCYEEVSYTVSITEPVVADVFESKDMSCELYELKELSAYNKYYTAPNGQGIELKAGQFLEYGQTVYVYALSDDEVCDDESSFTITYLECPIQKGISPNGDGINDYFDLSTHGVTNLKIFNRYGKEVYSYGKGYTKQWGGQDNSGNALPTERTIMSLSPMVLVKRDGYR